MHSIDQVDALPPESRLRILHVSGDFPDPIEPFKTPVIRSLVEMTAAQFEHRVFSLNRKSPSGVGFMGSLIRSGGRPRLQVRAQPFEHGTALIYRAPPKGLLHATMLRQLGHYIAGELEQAERPHLLVGHKLAIEGIAVRAAADRLGIPYALSIQGDSDTKILQARPDLIPEMRRIFHGARMVFPFAPWALTKIEAMLGPRSGPTVMLPCPTDLDTPMAPVPGDGSLVSVFHLKNWQRKNLPAMAAALRSAEFQGNPPPLSIIGGGSERDIAQCRKAIGEMDAIELAGPLDRAALRSRMNGATAFVMPSRRESYGLAFIEALFCGLPVIYPAGTSVDGYFDGLPFAIKVDPKDPATVARAMIQVVQHEDALKAALGEWQQSEHARKFTRTAIADRFASGLRQAVG